MTRVRHGIAVAIGGGVIAVAASVAPIAPAAPAVAHNTVVATTPEDDGTASTQPGTVSLTTSDALLDFPESTALQIVGPDGRYYETACPVVDGETLSAPAELGAPGAYTVAYQFVSADGHPTGGEFAFEWAPAAGEAVATGADAPVCASSGGGESDAAISTAAPLDEAGSEAIASSDLVWLGGGALAVIAAAVVTWLVARRRTPGAAPPEA